MFQKMLEFVSARPHKSQASASSLFEAMRSGGEVGYQPVEWFNGGLFDDDHALPLDRDDIRIALAVARLDWAEIDPSILGTLFERGLDPAKRSQLGAHYTDRDKIMMIVHPIVVQPWLAQWQTAKARIADAMEKSQSATSARARSTAREQAASVYRSFLDGLRSFRVLDPACGSGNFLYLALLALKDIEHRVSLEAEALGLQREFPQIGPHVVKGIEINAFATELARVSVWIGEIQWMLRNGFGMSERPILKQIDNIECRDAILNQDGSEAVWPKADVVIGNPPFLGAKKMVRSLGRQYVNDVRKAFDRLPAFVDLVTYWFEKARGLVADGSVLRLGLVGTNSIAMGTNLSVMTRLAADTHIFEAWSDEEWTVEGADVRVAIVCAERKEQSTPCRLDAHPVDRIGANLSGSAVTLTDAGRLTQNERVAFVGIQKTGPFDIPGELARSWLQLPLNPNGRPNSDVLRPHLNGIDVSRRPRDRWIIDFGTAMSEAEAALYEAPFAYAKAHVRPVRLTNAEAAAREFWWRHWRPRPEMREAIQSLTRVIVTPEVTKHRVFVWKPLSASFDKNLTVFARDDDVTFGILHSRFHEQWSLSLCTWLGVGNDPRYTPSTTFETFPFPEGLTPDVPAAATASAPHARAIAAAARRLNTLREEWLNPADLVIRTPEVVTRYPDRTLPKDETAAKELKGRTLTSLYNARPQWLANAHAELDAAVAAAYGWPAEISREDALARLFELNQDRAARDDR